MKTAGLPENIKLIIRALARTIAAFHEIHLFREFLTVFLTSKIKLFVKISFNKINNFDIYKSYNENFSSKMKFI